MTTRFRGLFSSPALVDDSMFLLHARSEELVEYFVNDVRFPCRKKSGVGGIDVPCGAYGL